MLTVVLGCAVLIYSRRHSCAPTVATIFRLKAVMPENIQLTGKHICVNANNKSKHALRSAAIELPLEDLQS